MRLPKQRILITSAGDSNMITRNLANVFSEATGTTIEHYIIAHKIERVKELLFYNELNISQIANKLNYSSVAHLCTQFKKVTGFTPTHFKQLKHNGRIAHENVGMM